MRFSVVLAVVTLLSAMTLAAPQQRSQSALEQPEEKPHVAILKQINQINQDGSYTYGFEAADGSFRVETRDIHGNVKGKYGYVDEFGETKTVAYEAGKPQGFMPQGQHLPVIPRPSSSGGNVDDEFGTDEDWQSVDADQDGIPDPPRPKDQRTTPIVQARPSPPPTFVPAQPARPLTPTFIPAQQPVIRLQPQFQFQPQQQQQRPVQREEQFNGPIFPFQFASVPARAPHQFQGGFVPVPFPFQERQPRE